MFFLKVLIFTCLFVCTKIYTANVQIRLEGLSGTLKYNVNDKLSSVKNYNIDINQCFRNKIHHAVRSGLRSLGYYSPDIKLFLYSSSLYSGVKENYVLIIQVHPGEPVKISSVNVSLNGDVCYDHDYQELLVKAKSFKGKILNHGEYDDFKNQLLNIFLSKGYLDAKFSKNQLVVSPFSHQAFWNINLNIGQRYFFGATQFYGSQVNIKYLKNLSNIYLGTYYDNKLLIEFNRRLFDTNWFQSIVVSPNLVKINDEKSIPLDVFLTPSSSHFEVALGYSSDVETRLKVIWKKPCFNVYGHSIENTIGISIPEQFIDLCYKIPLIKSPLQEYYLLQLGINRENICNRQSCSIISMNFSRYWDSVTGWKRGIHLHWCLDYYGVVTRSKYMKLLYPGFNISRIRQRGGVMPIWGDSQRYSIDISNNLWRSHINFFFLQSQHVWIRTLFNKHRLMVRNNLGMAASNDLQSIIPFVRRFFCVNNNYLIRGYKYQALFFKSGLSNQLVNPAYLLSNALEYQYNIFEKLWIILLIDSGRVPENINNNFYFKFGVGGGIRWKSPVGPLKLDLASPVLFHKENKLNSLHCYIGLGPEL